MSITFRGKRDFLGPYLRYRSNFFVQIPLINGHLFCKYFVRLSVGNATKLCYLWMFSSLLFICLGQLARFYQSIKFILIQILLFTYSLNLDCLESSAIRIPILIKSTLMSIQFYRNHKPNRFVLLLQQAEKKPHMKRQS